MQHPTIQRPTVDVDGTEATLGALVTATPAAARVLERYGLDYCCGGGTTLSAACVTAGVDEADVRRELADLEPDTSPEWASMGAGDLVDHIVATHHAYLHRELPRLAALAAKVAAVHGERHPELLEVRRTYDELHADLSPHLFKEERVLFPAVHELEHAATMPWFPFGTTAGPISMMLMEHDRAGELLERLRELTGGYEAPADGCASYHALYAGLAEIEADTHLHVHKENNVLFPMVRRMEESLVQRARAEV
jgi:regulator of cell morphogenesis and NO signaling